MRAYSQDLREKVLRAVEQGYPREEIVKLLGVSRATIKRYLKQRRETGSLAPKAIAGRPPKKLEPLQAQLVEQLQAHADLRLEDHCRLWEQSHGVKVSTATMSRAIQRVGWTRKKRRWVPSFRREEERVRWREQMKEVEAKRLIFLDECGSNIALTPLYARARHRANAPMAACRQSRRQKYDAAGLPLALRGGGLDDH